MITAALRHQTLLQGLRFSTTRNAHFLANVPLKQREGSVKPEEFDGKPIILYFSAGWCRSCKMFTPKLRDFYNNYKGNDLKVVWVSRDRAAEDQVEYYNKAMPGWAYIPYGSPEIQEYLNKYDVKTIPAVMVVNDEGKVIDDGARMKIEREGNAEVLLDEWKKLL